MSDKIIDRLKFNPDGHNPAIIQDAKSLRILTLCYMNKSALEKTIQQGHVYVYRRSLGKLMMKGESSGHTQQVKSLHIDCEGKSLLIRVDQKRAACHQGYFSCYFEEHKKDGSWIITEDKVFDPDSIYRDQKKT